jgi:FkbM family methyltransferase
MSTTFHRIWFGDKAIPSDYERYWQAWQRQFPDCRFVTWTDADIDRLPLSRNRLREFSSHAVRADLARYEILHAEGGIYLDCDIKPHMPFAIDDITSRLTVCNETDASEYCSIGFIAAPPGHPIFLELIEHIRHSPIDETRANVSTGPWLFGAALKRHPHTRLPPATFYPYLYDEPLATTRMRDLSQTFGVHIWGGSWLTPAAKQDTAWKLLGKGEIRQTAATVASLDGPWAQDAATMIDTIRDIRQKTLQVAPTLFPNLAIRPEDRPAFEFGKVVDWLLAQNADHMVWQIGAADGILVDPLRPALINYDPPAVLLEPNPHLFPMLEKGYARNRNSRLLPVAYGKRAGELTLNAINPARAAALGLPDWVLGISSVYDDRNAIGGKTIDAATTEQIRRCIDRIPVQVIDHTMMLAEAGGRSPDILVVDAEGMDREIIDDVLMHHTPPQVIHFEIQCLDPADQQALLSSLADHYAVIAFGNDMTAYRHDVILEYARALYVDHGLPTIFAGAVAGINGVC